MAAFQVVEDVEQDLGGQPQQQGGVVVLYLVEVVLVAVDLFVSHDQLHQLLVVVGVSVHAVGVRIVHDSLAVSPARRSRDLNSPSLEGGSEWWTGVFLAMRAVRERYVICRQWQSMEASETEEGGVGSGHQRQYDEIIGY